MYHLIIEKTDLDLKKTLMSGQVFRYEMDINSTNDLESRNYYILIYREYAVLVTEEEAGYLFHCSDTEFKRIWYHYLDLGRDYETVNNRIVRIDPRLEIAINNNRGIRILRQDPFEMLITFIISQSKAIPQIRLLVNNIAKSYGTYTKTIRGEDIFSFPTAKQLEHLREEDFRMLKFGYRASYLVAAVKWALEEPSLLMTSIDDYMVNIGDEQLKKNLLSIKGVGDKVAACVMLFGYARHKSFPIDVWMRRIMNVLYFHEEDKKTDKDMEAFGRCLFGEDAGIAQQYLFEYGRVELKLMNKK